MPESPAFERAAEELEKLSGLERLAARGTLRLALKNVGLDPKTSTKLQVTAIVEKLLPQELASCGIADAAAVCAKVSSALADVEDAGPGRSAIEIFERLSGSGSDRRS